VLASDSAYRFADDFPDDPRLFIGAVQLSAQGNRLKGRLFARYLIEVELIPAPGSYTRCARSALEPAAANGSVARSAT